MTRVRAIASAMIRCNAMIAGPGLALVVQHGRLQQADGLAECTPHLCNGHAMITGSAMTMQ